MTTLALSPDRARERWTFALRLVLAVVGLTLLFVAQDVVRRQVIGMPANIGFLVAIDALDWVAWGLLVPAIFAIGRHHRLDSSNNRARHIGVWAAMGIVACVVDPLITGIVLRLTGARVGRMAPGAVPLGDFLRGWVLNELGLNLVIYGMIVGVFHAALYYRDLRARQLREADLEARLARAELKVLRMQLQPHFLFNALHTVSSLMLSDVPTAHRVITALGDLLRASIDHTARQEITLREELAFVERYLEIQQARFRARLNVEVAVPTASLDALVPSLVLQPLVENAIRHGIEPSARGGTIWIRGERRDDQLVLTVRDDGSSSAASEHGAAAQPTPGIGLANIEARLVQLYGDDCSFCAGREADGLFTVELSLPFRAGEAARSDLLPSRAAS